MTQPARPAGPSLLEQRTIEAQILKEVHDVLLESHGVEVARRTITEAARRSSIALARRLAAATPGGTSLDTFQAILPMWSRDGALELEIQERTARTLHFNVVRCRYAETYQALGLAEIGHLLSCNRDGAFCEGYDPKLKLERTQTIMQGAGHCDFKFRYEG